MKTEWYVSFHGGGDRRELNNIHVYSGTGRELRKALDVDHLPTKLDLRELRAYLFGPDNYLYVANAYREYSQVLRFRRRRDKHGQHRFHDVFVESQRISNPGLSHPFALAFDQTGNLLVSSQNTSLVLRYYGPAAGKHLAGKPMPPARGLVRKSTAALAPGTFCPSARQVKNGLKVVRGIVLVRGKLYVVDRDHSCINKLDPVTGANCGRLVHPVLLDKPIHLAAFGDTLYIGNRGNESVVKYDLRTERLTLLIPPKAGGLNNPSGLAFGNDGYIYVASRGSRQILRYRLEDGTPDRRPFLDHLQDEPQFISPIRRH